MTRKKFRSPQEKKALSYAGDCRNTFGENDKASRRLIPLRKAQEHRQARRGVAQDLSAMPLGDDKAADLIESDARHDLRRRGGWRKGADRPLGRIVAEAKERRERQVGRKARTRALLEAAKAARAAARQAAEAAAGGQPDG